MIEGKRANPVKGVRDGVGERSGDNVVFGSLRVKEGVLVVDWWIRFEHVRVLLRKIRDGHCSCEGLGDECRLCYILKYL